MKQPWDQSRAAVLYAWLEPKDDRPAFLEVHQEPPEDPPQKAFGPFCANLSADATS